MIQPTRIHKQQRIILHINIAVLCGGFFQPAPIRIGADEAPQGGVVVSGPQVEQSRFFVVFLSGVAVVLVGAGGGGAGFAAGAEGVVVVLVPDPAGHVGGMGDAAVDAVMEQVEVFAAVGGHRFFLELGIACIDIGRLDVHAGVEFGEHMGQAEDIGRQVAGGLAIDGLGLSHPQGVIGIGDRGAGLAHLSEQAAVIEGVVGGDAALGAARDAAGAVVLQGLL